MDTFVVECYWPGLSEDEALAVLSHVADLAAGASSGDSARSLGCILLPSDGMAMFLFCAPNEAVVREIGRRALVPFDRIIRSIHIWSSHQHPMRAEL